VKERSEQAWEQGETNPYRRIRALESVLGLPGTWLLHGMSPADLIDQNNITHAMDSLDPGGAMEDREYLRPQTGPDERSFFVEGLVRLNEKLAAVEARLDAIERAQHQDPND
jgi:hypothetical protein